MIVFSVVMSNFEFFAASFVVLFGGVIGYAYWINIRVEREQGIDPLDDELSRPAGESLRVKIAETYDEYIEKLFLLVLGICLALVAPFFAFPLLVKATLFVIGVVMAVFYTKQFRAYKVKFSNYQLGYKGERYVGQYLNELLREGFEVYHDLVFEVKGKTFNIDHVVLGSTGIFCIETKTRRKPKELAGKERARVVFDGEELRFPTFLDSYGVEQAMRNANYLSEQLSASTGDQLEAKAVLVLPGWYVERTGRGELMVTNPKELFGVVRGRRCFDEAKIQRVRHQLKQLCKLG